MSLRTRRGLGLAASLLFVAAACAPAAQPPGAGSPGATSPGAPGAGSPGATGSPQGEDQLFAVDYQPQEGKPGGSVVIGEWQAPDNLNPYYSNAFATVEVLYATHAGLWRVSSSGHWQPWLAAKMPKFGDNSVREGTSAQCPGAAAAGSPAATAAAASPTGSPAATGSPAGTAAASPGASPAAGGFEVDIELKPGLKWSDGQPLTLNDLRYTWQWVMNPAQKGLVAGTTGWEDIADIKVDSAGTKATVAFCKPYAGFYGLLSATILPQHYMSTVPVAQASERSMPVSAAMARVPASGPFMFTNAVSPSAITLKKNPNWTGGAFNQGAYLDEVKYSFYADVDGMKAAFLAGDLDVSLNMVQADYDTIKAVDPSIGKALIKPAWEWEHFDLNTGTGHEMLKDVNVRKAIEQGIDKEDLYKALFPSGTPPEQPACQNVPPGLFYRDPSVTCPAYDPEAAKAALDAAGWTDADGDGVREKGGVKADLLTCTTAGRPVRQLTLEKFQGYMKAIGITTRIKTADATSVVFAGWNDVPEGTDCSIYRGTFDVALYTSVFGFDLFGSFYYSYHTNQIPDNPPHDGSNTTRFSNPEMDAALDTLRTSVRTDQQIDAAKTIQRIDREQVPDISLYYRESPRGISNRLRNFFQNPSSQGDIWNIEDWWVEES
jgi:peptide/nickel transport system substrate-binding protein